METFIIPPQLPSVNTLDLNHHRRSAYWYFVIGFLGIVSFAITGLYSISVYEQNQQAKIDNVLNDTRTTQFLPMASEEQTNK
ncbi:MAG: hypothetical protein WC842_00360 [Candidatus Paceibacterota bacterium]|jgi:hypothetical protein